LLDSKALFLDIVNLELFDRYGSAWWNWNYMCDDYIIDSYVIILVEMKSEYWELKGNQGTTVTYASICFSMIELIWYYDD